MAVRELNRTNLEYFKGQLKQLQADSPRQFGSLDATGMLQHLRIVLDTNLGNAEAPKRWLPWPFRRPMYVLICYLMTDWPKGKLKGPDFFTPTAQHPFEEERALLTKRMEEFVEALERNPNEKRNNAILGPLTLRRWSRLNGVHFRHHFKQFGIE